VEPWQVYEVLHGQVRLEQPIWNPPGFLPAGFLLSQRFTSTRHHFPDRSTAGFSFPSGGFLLSHYCQLSTMGLNA
jgi:hypothetical protein